MRATVLLADYANLTINGKLNVMGVFRQITATSFPCRHLSMYLVIKLQSEPLDDLNREQSLIANLIDADGSVLHQIEMPFKFPKLSDGFRPEANFLLQINNLEFPYPGDYIWHIIVNNDNVGQFEFYLSRQPTENG